MDSSIARIRPPERLGRYEIVDRIGAGGMGEVLLAIRHGAAGFTKPVALKRILPQLTRRDDFLRQIQREASIASLLHHPNCVNVSELEEIDGEYLLGMELLFGASLQELHHNLRESGTRFPLGAAVRIAQDAARGLHAVHTLEDADGHPMGVVHRDVSPQNVFVTENGITKLLDFGISTALFAMARDTATNLLKGKFSYMAPEQYDGLPVDARADVWALAVTLWELVSGTPLFPRATPLVCMEAVKEQRIPLLSETRPEVPRALSRLVAQALERDRSHRLSSALDFATELETIARDLPGASHGAVAELVSTHASEEVERTRRLVRRAPETDVPANVPLDFDADEPSTMRSQPPVDPAAVTAYAARLRVPEKLAELADTTPSKRSDDAETTPDRASPPEEPEQVTGEVVVSTADLASAETAPAQAHPARPAAKEQADSPTPRRVPSGGRSVGLMVADLLFLAAGVGLGWLAYGLWM